MARIQITATVLPIQITAEDPPIQVTAVLPSKSLPGPPIHTHCAPPLQITATKLQVPGLKALILDGDNMAGTYSVQGVLWSIAAVCMGEAALPAVCVGAVSGSGGTFQSADEACAEQVYPSRARFSAYQRWNRRRALASRVSSSRKSCRIHAPNASGTSKQ